MGRNLKGTVCNQQTKAQIARRELVARLFKRGYTEAQIRAEVMKELALKSYSSQTVHADVVAIKDMWRAEVLDDVDTAMRLELKRIDDQIKELWDAWEKSKTDYKSRYKKQKGEIEAEENAGKAPQGKAKIKKLEQGEKEEICFGDPRYMAEIRQQLAERRKLLGLYAPDKREITGKDGKDLMPEPITIEIIDSRDKVDAKDTDN